jgi:hypothetical protein
LRSDSLYSAVLTVAITLASAAPIKVPASPKNDAATAEDTAARALAATCAALSCVRIGCSAELSGGTVVSVRGVDMSSVGRARRRATEDQRRPWISRLRAPANPTGADQAR